MTDFRTLAMSILKYDQNTGVFTWTSRRTGKAKIGGRADLLTSQGYRSVKVFGRRYSAHRLAWLFVYGEWPELDIDHRDRNGGNNAIANLRPATDSLNAANRIPQRVSAAGFRGVTAIPSGRFRASIVVMGKRHHIGVYRTPEDAHAAYMARATEVFGEYVVGVSS